MDGNGLCPGRQLYALRRCRGVSPIVYAGLVETGLEERSAFLGVFTELRSIGVSPSNILVDVERDGVGHSTPPQETVSVSP